MNQAASRTTSSTTLEEKLELLEARFTAPPSNQYLNNNNSSSPETMTLGPSQLSNALSNDASSNAISSHSFVFDTPSVHSLLNNNNNSHPAAAVLVTVPKQHSLDQVSRAVAKQMASRAAAAAAGSSLSNAATVADTGADTGAGAAEYSQESTKQSGNVSSSSTSFLHKAAVVQETPPASAVVKTMTTPPSKQSKAASGTKKRKSIPVKKELNNSNAGNSRTRKRSRGVVIVGGGLAEATNTTATSATTTLNHNNNNSKLSPQQNQQTKKTTPASATTASAAAASSATATATSTASAAPRNKIYDFFGIKSKTNPKTSSVTALTSADALLNNITNSTTTGGAASSGISSTNSGSLVVEQLQQQLQQLQQELGDKDQQLKAIGNNRTILHGALQSALTARDAEIRQLQSLLERNQDRHRQVLEEYVREQAERQAKQVREKLAVDGARLGRIVYTRAAGFALRGQVESWEDGYAHKQLRETRQSLKAKAAALAQRKQAALAAVQEVALQRQQQQQQGMSSPGGPGVSVGTTASTSTTSSITPLEAAEALASVEFHLANLAREEKELEKNEQALMVEKTAHIRALKRVASEDASRFRTRPKLHDRYVLRSLLGKGGFSEVWKAYDLTELREVAVKIHQLDPRWSDGKKENYTKHVSREYEIHRNVRHPRIVSLFDVFEIDINSFATVLECCNGTDLDTLLKERRQLPEAEARAVLLQILLGMQYLSQPSSDGIRPGIIHYDLKPGNILFDEFGDAKITDFGLSKIVDAPDSAESMELTSQGAGTYWYLPPECFVMDDKVRISNKVDVWAIGVIFYQMLFGKRPFGDGMTQDKLLTDHTMLNAREVKFPEKIVVSPECQEFLRACLKYEQSERPTIAQLCENPYVLS